MTETPVSFAGCAGWLHRPGGTCRNTAIVLCAPFGVECMWTYRSYRSLAQVLTAAGFAVLRFDYRGTGDSLGDETDPAAARAWIDSIHAGADALKGWVGANAVAFFGLRLGATLAIIAASERRDVRALVVWSPFVSGRAFVREARAFARLSGDASDATLQAGGYVLPTALVAELSALAIPAVARAGQHVLLLQRDDLQSDPALADQLRSSGATVVESAVGGYSAMMRDAHASVSPLDAIMTMVAWIADGYHEHSHVTPATPGATPLVTDAFQEHAHVFGTAAKLFGVVTVPRRVPRRAPMIVLPNVGSNHHIGPTRMMVTLARRLANEGFTVLRFDIAGLGDSTTAPGAEPNALYDMSSVRDAQAAMNFLDTQFGGTQYITVGLCSGAYLSYHATVADARVCHQVLINLLTFHWDPDETIESYSQRQFKSSSFYLNSWRSPTVWRRALRGQVNIGGIAMNVGQRFAERIGTGVRRTFRRHEQPVVRTFRTLASRGTSTSFVFGDADAAIDTVERSMRMPSSSIAQLPAIDVRVIQNADHAFTTPSARAELIDVLCDDLTRRWPE